MITKSMVESAWAEDMGQFLYHLDPDIRKIKSRLEKLQLKIIKCSIFFNKTCCQNIHSYIIPDLTYVAWGER